jgi:hypothetical protein
MLALATITIFYMNCRQMVVLVIFSLFLSYGCGKKNHAIHGKWYQSSDFYLEFRPDNSLYAEQQPGPANKSVLRDSGTYQIKTDSTLEMFFLGDNAPGNFIYKIKDSILVIIHPYEEFINDKKVQLYDSAFYHLNPKYPVDHIEQLYKWGKIIDTSYTR